MVAAAHDWLRYMRRGDWAAAWQCSDAVLRARSGRPEHDRPRHLQAVWDGKPLADRRVLVRCYHGLGDTIQFARFLPRVSRDAATLTVWAQPALIPLLQTLPNAGELLPLHDGVPDVAYDVDIELMELAHALRITPATLPAAVPYLNPPRQPRVGGDALAVGLVWQAGDWDPRRSIPPAALERLAALHGIDWHLLQRGGSPGALQFGRVSGADDVVAAASIMTSLDLVVTVDTMPAHLAGALGVPVWTLLQHDADWRWMEHRCDSPWYPTMRLFRQPRPGDWATVIAQVHAALCDVAQRPRPA